MRAYDLDMLPRPANRAAPDCHGWAFGLPPGIAPAQWPLDRVTGHPLMHGFTLLLPEDHRVHGPDIVALSFFAGENEGGTADVPGIAEALSGAERPADPALLPFWESARAAHPRLHRMKDILDNDYAVILLTRAEFEGPLCPPPTPAACLLIEGAERPDWLRAGSAAAFWRRTYSPSLDMPPERYGVYRMLGGIPDDDMAFHRALRWTPRANDPNAGRAARESWALEETGYVLPYDSETFENLPWAEAHKPDHIGGTMRQVQGVPERFGPHYVEFEEYLGGYNFGGGNAQLDFQTMRFDWACG